MVPIYEYKCIVCEHEFENIDAIDAKEPQCVDCGGDTYRMLSAHRPRSFDSQFVRDIQNEPVYVRNKQELTDAVNRFNDGELADKQGKVRVYE